MEDYIDIIVTETTNLIEITSQASDETIDVNIIDNREDITLNVTPTVVEININQLTGNFGINWGEITGTLSNQTDLNTALGLKADLVGGKVPSSQLPSYVDDVVEVANYAALPVTGETGKIYITLDTNLIYRWTGSTYVEIKDTSAVWGAITGTLSSQTDLQSALNAKDAVLTFNSPLSRSTNTISIPAATSSANGYLTSTDWSTFNAKQSALTFSSPLVNTSGTISMPVATSSANGYLSSTDWTTFNGKQAALSGTGFVKISGTTISYDNSTYLTTSTAASTYLALSGGTLTGKLTISASTMGAQINGGTFTLADASSYALGVANGGGYDLTFGTSSGYVNINSWSSKPLILQGQGSNNVLIATTSDNGAKLQVNGTATFSGLISANGGDFRITSGGLAAIGVVLSSNYDVISNPKSVYTSYGQSAILGGHEFRHLNGSGTGLITSAYANPSGIWNFYYAANFSSNVTISGNLDVTGTGGNISIPVAVEYLVVGGGGGGGADLGGGGGAGGFLAGTTYLTKGTFSVVQVGNGGRGSGNSGNSRIAENGGNSSLFHIIAYGGGGGACNINRGLPGASGGGGSREAYLGGTTLYPNQGYAGGAGGTSSPYYVGGGGGGADGAGGSGGAQSGGNGGTGKISDISGTSTYYAGGGGGCGYGSGGGTGGSGGGGNGSNGSAGNTAGTANTGGGGGGGGNITGTEGSNGGSGIVIIKYADTYPTSTCTGTYSYATSGGYRRYTFTGNGTIKLMA